jgi:RHS repeat-associated protein
MQQAQNAFFQKRNGRLTYAHVLCCDQPPSGCRPTRERDEGAPSSASSAIRIRSNRGCLMTSRNHRDAGRPFTAAARKRSNLPGLVALAVAALTFLGGISAPVHTTQASADLIDWGVDDTPVVIPEDGAGIDPQEPQGDEPTHDPTVGTLAGEAMAEGGAATYSIPITLPPGRKGMQPSLSLSYSSRTGAGTAGMGWSIGGLSSIHRCPRTPEQDGESRAVRGDASDRLCLDGLRLLVVNSGTLAPVTDQAGYGNANAIYRSEIDSFVRVSQFGAALGAAGSCFKVETKSGIVRYYGGTQSGGNCSNDARVIPGGATAPLSWMLKREVDPLGNSVTYNYGASDITGAYGAGEVLLQSVQYTGFGADPGNRSVTLVYEPRPLTDQTSSYVAGGMTRQTRRLSGIGTFDGSQAVRTYVLEYRSSVYSGRSLLDNVTECGHAPITTTTACHDPTKFTYADSSTVRWPHEFKRLTISGLADVQLQQPDTMPETEPPPGPVFEAEPAAPLANAARPSTVRELGDFDGDGSRELGITHFDASGNAKQYLAAFAADRQQRGIVDADVGLGVQGVLSATRQLADVNGDGRTDVVGRRMSSGQRKLTIGVWTTANTSWLPTNFVLHDLGIPLPSPTLATSCENVSFADMNGDGRADLVLEVPSAMACATAGNPFPAYEMRIYLGQIGSNPLVPTFAATPSATRALANVPGSNGTVHRESATLMDFDGDGLPDVLVSRPADQAEQDRSIKLWFGRNVGGTYTLGGAGQEITSITALANPPLAADEIHKQAYTQWADVNGDGLPDWIAAVISPTDGLGYWAVRLNKGGVLGARMMTSSRRGLERCINDPRLNTTGNHCGVRWQPVFPALMRSSDVDSDGRADLLVPRAFAARLCIRRTIADTVDPGGQNYEYWCPENPQNGELDPAPAGLLVSPRDKYYGMYAPGGNAADGTQAGRYGGDFDPSAYFLDALRFVQTGENSFDVETTATDIVRGQSSFDLYGDGLTDQITYVGNPYVESSTLPRLDALALSGSGVGPDTLPDGTRVTDLETMRLAYVSENIGTGRIEPTLAEVMPEPAEMESAGVIPRLPELMTEAENGLGDKAIWIHLPLGAGLSVGDLIVADQPFYSIPAQRYTDARHYYFASSMPVVHSLRRSNGIGYDMGARTQFFTYAEAMFNHQGRGFQGFRQIATYVATNSEAVARELRTLTTFHQKFPLTGKIASTTVAPSSRPGYPITRQVNDWRCTLGPNERQTCPGDGATPAEPQRNVIYFPYLDRQVATTYDLAQAESGTSTPLSEVETLNAASSGASGWDAYGNLRDQVVVSRDLGSGTYPEGRFIEEHKRTTTRSYTANTTTWFLDRLASETVTTSISYSAGHTVPAGVSAPNQTLTTTYTWNDDRTPSRQVIQPGMPGQEATTAWCYRTATADCPSQPGTNYGLPSSTVVSAPDAGSPRRTSYAYSKNGIAEAADGYFLLTTTNALGHVATTERRPRDGGVSRAIAPTLTSVVTLVDAFERPVLIETRGTDNALIEPAAQIALGRHDDQCANTVGPVGGGGEDFAVYCMTTVKAGAPTTLSWHDMLGRPVKAAQRGFDGRFIVTKTEYDLMGTVQRQSMPRYADAASDQWQVRSYDRQGRLTRQTDPATDLAAGNGDRLTKYTYAGRRTTVRVQDTTLSEGSSCAANSTRCYETRTYTNVLGQALYTADAAGAATRSWLDPNGKPVGIQDNEGVLTRASHDARGRRTQSIDPDQGLWTFVHNGLDELVTQTDARGAVTTVAQRDSVGRVRQLTRTPPSPLPAGMVNDVLVDEWIYDPVNGPGQLSSLARKRGTSVGNAVQVWKEAYGYEATTRRPSTITSTLENEPGTWSSGVTYDSNGREATRSYPSGLAVRTDYTAYGQLRRLSNNGSGAIYWTATAADAWNKVTAETFGNGLTGAHSNAASTGQSKQLLWKNGPAVVEQFDYAYDAFGNLKSQQRGTRVESYAYDVRQRLTTTAVSGGASVNFAYSASGNLLRKTDFSANGNAYSYGANGCGPHGASSVLMPTGSTVTYACDANGNVIGGSALSATFDAENRPRTILRSANGSGGDADLIFRDGFDPTGSGSGSGGAIDGSASYAYDAKGGRYQEITTGRTTRYGPNGYEKTTTGTTTHRHELGPVVVARVGSVDTVSYVLRDRLGSTIAVSNTATTLTERRQFDAFGKARNADFTPRPAGQANLSATNRGFTAHTQADDVWLVHMNGRVYDQNLGRFLSVDPVVQDGGSQALNPYSYIQNNPLSGTDPSGYASEKEECAGSKGGGCTVPLTQAVKLTGSHIKGISQDTRTSGGSSLTVVSVNPTPGGQAEIQVALAGSSSGYVAQAAVIEKAASTIAADKENITNRQPTPLDRNNASSGKKSTAPYTLPMYDKGEMAAIHANTELLAMGMFATAFSSDEDLARKWADVVYPIASMYGVEIGSKFSREAKDIVFLGSAFSDGRRTEISLLTNADFPYRGFVYATIHTHPDNKRFSGTTGWARWAQGLSSGSQGENDIGDLRTAYDNRQDAFVVGPGHAISGWRYQQFQKDAASSAGGWAYLGQSVYEVRR